MKFEKFLKSVGTHGNVVERPSGEKWLVCCGVGMVIPRGVDNLLGTAISGDHAEIVNALATLELDDVLTLHDAVLFDPAGKASDIYRVFRSESGEKIGIINADFGLIERKDTLGYAEIEIPEKGDKPARTVKFAVVYDKNGDLCGFITGFDKF